MPLGPLLEAGGETFAVADLKACSTVPKAEWGTHELVDATRNMLHVALAEPRNEAFVLLSESGVPLYPPHAVHQQLLSEGKSRIDSCGGGVRCSITMAKLQKSDLECNCRGTAYGAGKAGL